MLLLTERASACAPTRCLTHTDVGVHRLLFGPITMWSRWQTNPTLLDGFSVVPATTFLIENYQFVMVPITICDCVSERASEYTSLMLVWRASLQLKLAKIRSSYRMFEDAPAWSERDWQVLLAGSAVNVVNKNHYVIESGSSNPYIFRYDTCSFID